LLNIKIVYLNNSFVKYKKMSLDINFRYQYTPVHNKNLIVVLTTIFSPRRMRTLPSEKVNLFCLVREETRDC